MRAFEKNKLIAILKELARNEIRIAYHDEGEILSTCTSKIGGRPAVPDGFIWPRYLGESFENIIKERPLSFMAQFNLEELKAYDTENLLPEKGMLSFFYEQITMPWGYDPEHHGSAKVYYFPTIDDLKLMDAPEDIDEEAIMPELAVTFEKHVSIPVFEDFPEDMTDMEIEWEDYDDCSEELGCRRDQLGEINKLLGYPDTIQNAMLEECEEMIEKVYPSEAMRIYVDENGIVDKSKDWILLFQMGTIETKDMEYMFGDCGHIYFWIRKHDLMNKNFDKIWLILQCG